MPLLIFAKLCALNESLAQTREKMNGWSISFANNKCKILGVTASSLEESPPLLILPRSRYHFRFVGIGWAWHNSRETRSVGTNLKR